MLASAQYRWLICICGALLAACKPFDSDLLKRRAQRSGNPPAANETASDAALGADGGDAGLPSMPNDGTGGASGSPMTGASGPGNECVVNPNWIAGPCPVICPESCNGEDDDCDGSIDEDLENACKLDHALSACNRGHCAIVSCEDRFRDCDHDPVTGCEVSPTDVDNCGSCGNRCVFAHAMPACVDDHCTPNGCEALFADCDHNGNDCETAANTAQNCAACGKACTDADVANATASCERGFCGVGQCFTNHGDCNELPGDGCEQTLDSTQHCGTCKQPCDFAGSVDDCSTGTCLAQSCEPGFDDCDGNPANGCESLDTQTRCGACDKVCDDSLTNVASASCDNQQCTPICASGFADCDNNPSTGCETSITTLTRCGECSTPCGTPNAVVTCDSGVCSFVRCEPGYDDCNNDLASDGCETVLNADTHCGSCNNDCTGSGKPICSGGSCTDVTCPDPNTADCNKDGLPCEVNLTTDVNHCGSCSNACAFTSSTPHAGAGLSCNAGRCKPNCDALFAECNNDYRDGCETPLTTLSNCAQCGTGCAIANATATCASGSCRVSQCAADWADCDADSKSCEVQLGTAQNCTGCAMACSLPNALSSCAGGAGNHSCAIASCRQSYFQDCDGTAANGCEVDVRGDAKNCGQCRYDCSKDAHVAGATCGNGVCGYTCASNFGNCNSTAGCETSLTTNTDCRACGVNCSRTNGSASCSTGSCQLTGCNAGFKDCDSNPGNGCESLSTLTDCGDCGLACSIVNGTGSCATQSCAVASCSSGWDDCDGNPANGCERNITSPASGGLGPCFPDSTGCSRQVYNGQDYFFCTTPRTWSDARAHCAQLLLGELVHINDMAENIFVQSQLSAASWLGGGDSAVEGTWRWANDNSVFFMSGTAVGYSNWAGGEPNDAGGNEDCAEAYATGLWNDQACTSQLGFVCEVQKDLCPSDPNKANPGQCGCGRADTDGDNDGTADCNDACPSDPAKIAAGLCGCGRADTDSDGDGTPDCNDGCPADPTKSAPGVCGCGVADTDGDTDGVPDCHDACPQDPTRSATPCGLDYTPTNFNQSSINFGLTPSANLDCQTTTIDTSGAVTITNWCGTAPTPIIQSQAGGPDLVILPLQSLTIASGSSLRVIGARPLILAVRGDLTLNGTLDARASGATPGAGGNVSCSGGNGGNGSSDSNSNEGAGGGGGAGFGNSGGRGGAGNRGNGNGTAGGGAGASEGGTNLSPLRGGCKGGKGGNGSGTGGGGGAGGGAVQISAGGSINVGGSAIVSASGGAGLAAGARRDGGGGGGSGGAVLLEAHVVTVSSGAWITANGGGAASGYPNTNSGSSAAGTDGSSNSSSQAPGASGSNSAGNGGNGAAGNNNAGNGGDGTCDGGFFCFGSVQGAGGGGGGGGVGRIRIHGTQSCSLNGNLSPAAGARNCP